MCLRLVHTDKQAQDDGDVDPRHHTHDGTVITMGNHIQLYTLLQKSKMLLTILEKAQAASEKAHERLIRATTVRAMGLRRGHWYKCKCGYVYCIGNCGRAMQTASCPECKGNIGGASHTLAEGNVLAPEMTD